MRKHLLLFAALSTVLAAQLAFRLFFAELYPGMLGPEFTGNPSKGSSAYLFYQTVELESGDGLRRELYPEDLIPVGQHRASCLLKRLYPLPWLKVRQIPFIPFSEREFHFLLESNCWGGAILGSRRRATLPATLSDQAHEWFQKRLLVLNENTPVHQAKVTWRLKKMTALGEPAETLVLLTYPLCPGEGGACG